jgi:O-antigen ligase
VQVDAQPFELHSLDERRDLIDMAVRLIAAQPLSGVGAANFSVMSERLLGYPLDWVHNVPLLVTSELGLPGLAAFAAMIGSLLATAWARWRSRSMTVWQALIGGGLVALVSVMFFDHYLWTAPQGMLLWAWLAGWWVAE